MGKGKSGLKKKKKEKERYVWEESEVVKDEIEGKKFEIKSSTSRWWRWMGCSGSLVGGFSLTKYMLGENLISYLKNPVYYHDLLQCRLTRNKKNVVE